MLKQVCEPGMANARILVVEDDALIAFDLCELLRDQGAQIVGPFGRLDTAIEAATHETISVALLDIRIHDGQVFPVSQILSRRRIPFVFYTGHGQEADLKKDWPGCKVLRKPTAPETLLNTLSILLHAPRAFLNGSALKEALIA